MDIVPDPPGTWTFNEVYLYEELMEADLHAIVSNRVHVCTAVRRADFWKSTSVQIRSGQPLSDAHFQSFLYQTLCGLKVSSLEGQKPHITADICCVTSTSTLPTFCIGI